jgi:hypothetical protein
MKHGSERRQIQELFVNYLHLDQIQEKKEYICTVPFVQQRILLKLESKRVPPNPPKKNAATSEFDLQS